MAGPANGAREVWITGYGLLSPAGETPEAWWAALGDPKAWRAGIDEAAFAPYPVHPVAAYDLARQVSKPGDQKAMGPTMHYGVYAAGLALEMAGLKGNAELLPEIHLVVAAGGGERDAALDEQILAKLPGANDRGAFLNRQLADGLRPTLFLQQLPNLFAGNISIIHGVAGSSRTFMGEESAGIDAVRIAERRIQGGQGDMFLVGATYCATRHELLHQYQAGNVLLTGPWQPLWRRPDAGMALGSAGAFLVLEARERAERRGARPRARLAAVESGRTVRAPGAAAFVAERQWRALAPKLKPGPLAVLSGASGRGPITAEERNFLGKCAKERSLAVRGTAAALGHSMEASFVQNLVLAAAAVERGTLFAPLDPAEPLEAAMAGPVDRVLVTGWGHNKGEGLALVEAA